ncbi:MAG: hypothetical protein HY326_10875 [Chloroflexi bacterium]|nr:hypothetical protein [Chloroflexota bacterium]
MNSAPELGVTYIASHLPQHITADMHHLAEIGCTEVLFALQENHIYALTGALRFGASIARDAGLRPYAVIWGYANTFGGGRMSRLLLEHPDVRRLSRDGSRQQMACLNHPLLIDRFLEITALCREHGFAGIFVDEPTVQQCFCEHCQALFNGDLLQAEDTPAYRDFQMATVTRYTAEVCRRVKELDPHMVTITCIMPRDRACWEQVAGIAELDILGTDPYWLLTQGRVSLADAVADTRDMKDLCQRHGKQSQIWLNAWHIPAGREPEIYSGGQALAAVGCDSFYTWSYRGGLGTYEESDNPTLTWDNVCRLYRELAGRSHA